MGVHVRFLLTFLYLLFLILHVYAQDESVHTVEAKGVGIVVDNNTALARDDAIRDALRKAVEQAVGTLVSSETMVENFQVLSDNIYTKTRGYIKNYKVLSESKADNLYQVVVRATVAMGSLKDDLDAIGLLHKKVEKPRVLFMIAEQNIGQKYYIFWWSWWGGGKSEFVGESYDLSVTETTLKDIFLEKGFNVVDIIGSQERIEISNAFRVADLTDDGARSIARKLNADIVIRGKAFAKEGPRTPGSSVGSYLADVTAHAIRVDDGRVLASGRGHGVARHVSEVTGGTKALERAAKDLGEKMVEKILAKWSSGTDIIKITIRGITSYKTLSRFKNILKTRIRGVEEVYQRKFEGGEAVLDVEASVTAQRLADDIARIEEIPLDVTGTTVNTIDIRF